MNQSKMGKLIKKIRKEKGLTQAELADKLNLSCKTISKWECGNGCPDISVLKELSEILDISISELLSGELGDKKEIDSCIVESVSYYNRRFKKKIVILIVILLLCLMPVIVLLVGEMGKFKHLPSFTTLTMNNKTEKLALALKNYDYDLLKDLFSTDGKVAVSSDDINDYSLEELLVMVKKLEDRGVEFTDFSYDGSTYGDKVYYNVSFSLDDISYEAYYNMEYDTEIGKYIFLIYAPIHDGNEEVYEMIEDTFCPSSIYFES